MKHPPTIETARLILRPFRIEDADRVQALAGAAEVYRTTLNVPHPYEDGMAEKWIASHASLFYDGRGVNLAMTLKSDATLIGSISLGTTKPHRRAELGYWVGVSHWGQGYCTEAAIAGIKYGFDDLGLHKVTSRHMADNSVSGRVMQKAGMVQEGVLREEVLKDGVFHDLVVYGLLASEFESEQAPQGEARYNKM